MFIDNYKEEIKEYFIKNYSRIKFYEDEQNFQIIFFDKETNRDYKLTFDYYFRNDFRLVLHNKPYSLMQSFYIDQYELEFKEMEYIEYIIREAIKLSDRYCRQYEEREDYFNII